MKARFITLGILPIIGAIAWIIFFTSIETTDHIVTDGYGYYSYTYVDSETTASWGWMGLAIVTSLATLILSIVWFSNG